MKKIKLIGLLFVLVLYSNSCLNSKPQWDYDLWLRIQDTSGNDLVKDIEYEPHTSDVSGGIVKHEVYSLFLDVNCCGLKEDMLLAKDGYSYQIGILSAIPPTCTRQKVITYNLKCSYIFGNNDIHKIISYWNYNGSDNICQRIEINGNEFTQVIYDERLCGFVATIILDR